MLDQLPPEICTHVFDFACRDSGCTGRSLALVSRYIRQTSQRARYSSIALVGRAQILAFARFLEQTPTQLNTRYLIINGKDTNSEIDEIAEVRRTLAQVQTSLLRPSRWQAPVTKEQKETVERDLAETKMILDEYGEEGANAVITILRNLASTLTVLDISLNTHIVHAMSHTIHLPRLMDFTTRCAFPLRCDDVPVLEPTHSLRYLHVVDTVDEWDSAIQWFKGGSISHFAPSLTHLRLSQLEQDESVIIHLECALGLRRVPESSRITHLPSTIELILIKPAVAPPPSNATCECCDKTEGYRDLLKYARRLRNKDPRVLLLEADTARPAEDEYLQEWMDKVDGAACSWDTSNVDTAR
ncbi:hypothetical protein B0H14DRAFT_23372 [Mycena olivaceomarginata]|nr:hypothetical protein B0H14DRAFT_23372 [Mycena olivaceomarginata]